MMRGGSVDAVLVADSGNVVSDSEFKAVDTGLLIADSVIA